MDRFADLREKVLPVLHPYVKRVAVFGSFARGEETPESDIDHCASFPEAT
jgi:predicted nucleotidyltransferase